MHTTCFSTKTYLNELRRSWDATWRSCRARRVAGVQRMGRQECSLRTEYAGSSRRRGARSQCIHIGSSRGSSHTLPVSRSTTTSYIRAAAISAPNTSSMLPMDGRPTSSRQCGKDHSRVRLYDSTARRNRLGRWMAR